MLNELKLMIANYVTVPPMRQLVVALNAMFDFFLAIFLVGIIYYSIMVDPRGIVLWGPILVVALYFRFKQMRERLKP